jgi:putative DNA primase/helicase
MPQARYPAVFAENYSAYLQAGWVHPLPLGAPGRVGVKSPPPDGTTGWSHPAPGAELCEAWAQDGYAANNIGLRLPTGVVGIDVDDYDDKHGAAQLAALEAELGPLPPAPRSTSRGAANASGIRFYLVPEGTKLKGKFARDIECIQHGHRYAVGAPSRHPNGGVYAWLDRNGVVLERVPRVDRLKALPGAWLERFAADADVVKVAGTDYTELSEGAARKWVDAHSSGEPCRAMKGVFRAACSALADEEGKRAGSHYDTAVEAVYALVKLATEEHRGLRPALKAVGAAYAAYIGAKPDRDGTEWTRMVVGAVSKLAPEVDEEWWAAHLHNECPDRETLDPEVADRLWPSPNAPLDVAHQFLDRFYAREGECLLRFWRDDFYVWGGARWSVVDAADLDAQVTAALADAEYFSAAKVPILLAWHPDKSKTAKVLHSLSRSPRVFRDSSLEPDTGAVDFANGVLDLGSRALKPATPARFNVTSLPFRFDPDAGSPTRWLAFLDEVLMDEESIALLQEWFGYVISADTRLQRFLFMLGPSRSGKGTIVRTLEALLGPENVAAPTSGEIATRFGLSPIIGKSLAVVQDASFSGRDGRMVVERLKTLTGKDSTQIDRKNRDAWFGRPSARWMIVSNEMLSLIDSSGALMRRMAGPIETARELSDAEINEDLDDELAVEMGAILLWALDGLERLASQRWKFTSPQLARNIRREMVEMMSPIKAFARECFVATGEGYFTDSMTVYGAYRLWCAAGGRDPMPPTVFGKDMKSGLKLDRKRRRISGGPVWGYEVELSGTDEEDLL